MVATKLGSFEHPRETDTLTLTRPDLEGLLAGTDNQLPESALTTVGDFDFEIYWFNRRYLAKIDAIGNQDAVRALVKKWSSIMLFRDGFRVFPYGDEDDDWLGLDAVASWPNRIRAEQEPVHRSRSDFAGSESGTG